MKEKDKQEIMSSIRELLSSVQQEQQTLLNNIDKKLGSVNDLKKNPLDLTAVHNRITDLKAQVDDNTTTLAQMKAALITYTKRKEMQASKTARKLDAETLKSMIPGYAYRK